MCTFVFIPQSGGGYRIAMNRDEQRTRPLVDEIFEGRSDRNPEWKKTYPVDPKGGGTWIGVRSDGLTLALLNQSAAFAAFPAEAISRGTLIPALLESESAKDAAARLAEMMLSKRDRFLPFLFVASDRERGPLFSLRWTGEAHAPEPREIERAPTIFSSSGVAPAAVAAYREDRFREFMGKHPDPNRADLFDFLKSWDWGSEALSVRMSRTDARTVSHSVVLADGPVATLEYVPVPETEAVSYGE